MKRYARSLAAAMAAVGLLSLGLAAVTHPSPIAAGWAFSLALAALILAVFGAVFNVGRRRVFWCGAATFGWVYMALNFLPGVRESVGSKIITNIYVDILYNHLPYSPHDEGESVVVAIDGQAYQGTVVSIKPDAGRMKYEISVVDEDSGTVTLTLPPSRIRSVFWDDFAQLCHSLLALIVGFVGGIAARMVAYKGTQATSERESVTE